MNQAQFFPQMYYFCFYLLIGCTMRHVGSLTFPEIKSLPPAVEVWSCDHWTARENLLPPSLKQNKNSYYVVTASHVPGLLLSAFHLNLTAILGVSSSVIPTSQKRKLRQREIKVVYSRSYS